RREQAQARVHQLDQDAAAAGDRARQAAANVVTVEAAQRRVEVHLVETRIRLDDAIIRSRRTAAEMYRGVSSAMPPVLGALAHDGSLGDLALRQHYLRQAGERSAQSLTEVRIARLDVADSLKAVRRQRRDAVDIAAAAHAEQARLAELRARQDQAVVTAVAEEQREQALLASVQARKAEFERAAQRQQAASGTIEQVLNGRPSRGNGSRHFLFPADGPISSPFGWRVHPIFHTRRLHTGIDIGASYGSSVRAGAAGTVAVAGVISGYGNAIVIDHGGGIATLYGHLSRFGVRVGQTVSAGATIGAVGNTGNSTGPHLHFEVRVQGVPVDPMPYL
ncbi:MAG: M23 family metallopeptidase, partial [Acidimicrobiia bacterium]|nr:M23 family metallopeptidase [Acidimicrobiia bacterium]